MHFSARTMNGPTVASGAILMALLDHMLADGMLRPIDVRNILNGAISGLKPNANTESVGDAIAIIRDQMLPRFQQGLKKD